MDQDTATELREQQEINDLYGALRAELAGMSPTNPWRPCLSQFLAAMLRDVSAGAQGRSGGSHQQQQQDRPLLRAV